jgi:eukaryotic-like serine/threonine-protein kinase
MAIGTPRSSKGDEPIQEGSSAPHRPGPDSGEHLLLRTESTIRWLEDPSLGETVAYQDDASLTGIDARRSPIGRGGGFAEVDDLKDQTLGQYRLESVIGTFTRGAEKRESIRG